MTSYLIQDCGYGQGLFASEQIISGQRIAKFDGYETDYASLSDEQKRLVIYLGSGRAFVITNELVFVNHACEPNCRIEDDWLVAQRLIQPGEQLSFNYNVFPAERLKTPDDWWWDPLWNFDCRCGSSLCQGRIAGYRFV
ncbi:MAG: SET domain-containing protein-lysine N-methyltransferase [Caldilineaceae bacterium]